MIEWGVAIGAATFILWLMHRAATRGLLDSGKAKWWLWGGLFLAFIGTVVLKLIEIVIVEDQPYLIRYVFCRKVDDISFWMMVAGLGVGFAALEACAREKVMGDKVVLRTWLILSALSIAAYLYIVGAYNPSNAGTFFWEGSKFTLTTDVTAADSVGESQTFQSGRVMTFHSHPETKRVLQIAEGCCVVWFLVVVHLIHAVYLWSLRRADCAKLTKFTAFKVTGLYAFIMLALGVPLALIPGWLHPLLRTSAAYFRKHHRLHLWQYLRICLGRRLAICVAHHRNRLASHRVFA